MEVSTDSNNVLSSVFFQKQSWQDMYARYPELILIAATYNLNNLHMPILTKMLIVNHNKFANSMHVATLLYVQNMCIIVATSRMQTAIYRLFNCLQVSFNLHMCISFLNDGKSLQSNYS